MVVSSEKFVNKSERYDMTEKGKGKKRKFGENGFEEWVCIKGSKTNKKFQ